MIRIVENITAVDRTGHTLKLPLIPASARLAITQERGEQGLSRKYELSFRLEEPYDNAFLQQDLILYLDMDDGGEVVLGTSYLPVRLSIQENDSVQASCSWQKAL